MSEVERGNESMSGKNAGRREQAPAASGARWKQFFDLSLDMLAIASLRHGRWTSVNTAMIHALGFSEAELLARPFMSSVHPDDVARSRAALRSLSNEHSRLDFEQRVLCHDGSYRQVAWHAVYHPDEGALYCVGRDVTDTRRAEAERAELLAREQAARAEAEVERQKRHDLFLEAPVGICILEGPQHTFSFANHAYRALVGGRELIGKGLLDALPELRGQGFESLLDRVVASGAPHVGRSVAVQLAREVAGEPEEIFLDFVYAPHWNAQRQATGVLVCAFDVTEHARARNAAESTTAELEAIIQSLPDAVYVGDACGIQRANQRALTMLGYDDLAELNRSIGTLAAEIETRRVDTGALIPADAQAFARALSGSVDVQEVQVRHLKTGEERVLRCACAPVRVGGEVVAAVAINSDITERKRTEAVLRERAEFEQQLIGIVSHDLRNPLNVILLGVESVLARQPLDERGKSAVHRIRSSAKRATRMINDLLDLTLARLGSGIPVRPQPLDLHTLTRRVVEELRASFPGRDLRVETEGDGRGVWDADRLDQVVTNLATNALKYSPVGTPVRVRVWPRGDSIGLEVHNQGPPIPLEAIGRLFEPMQRASSQPDRVGRSMGLGLFIVRLVVEAHAGSVSVESSAEAGTTFTVCLPRTRPEP